MMTNLFSTFDPATSIKMSLNWLSTFIIIIILPSPYWLTSNRIMLMMTNMIMKLYMEFKNIINDSKGMILIPISIFMFIMINNMFGIMPYIFTSTSHMSCTFALALPMWISFMIFGWINNYNKMFEHMIPVGTPSILMPFMVLIETVSNLIRPGSLSVRLFANMVAGHLLMSMLGSCANSYSMMLPLLLILQLTLTFFETAVAIVQAYVFSVLTVLYSSEVV
uniref:ATP synthase subunit a n=1 Tax=Thaumastocoris safordi TaxID=1589682 RepID=A0A8T9ZY45_9HEMI|nr:ATPase subunit 6 [Thaumastocoris safordi]